MFNNRIQDISPLAFSDLVNLRTLFLDQNNLQHIDNLVFSNLTNLKTLDLSYNNLLSIDSQIFSDLQNLQQLYISNNRIDTIDSQAFSNLIHLKELSLNHNELQHMDSQLWSTLSTLHHLQAIRLQDNRLTQFEWPTSSRSYPRVYIGRNDFSNTTRRELRSYPNHPNYVFEFHTESRSRTLSRLNERAISRSRARAGLNPHTSMNPRELSLKDLTRI